MEEQKKEILEVLEKNLCTCKTCGKLKQRNLAGRWHGKDKKYVDELGLFWNGTKHCGICNLDRVRSQMAKMREKRKQEALMNKLEQKSQMTLEDIKTNTLEVNELGKYILRLSDLLDQMPSELQPKFAEQLLEIIYRYYKEVDLLKASIDSYQKNGVVDISIGRLKRELDKFDQL